MRSAPKTLYKSNLADSDVLPALRELFSQRPAMTWSGLEALSRALYVLGYLSHQPELYVVEAALEALDVERDAA